MPLTRSALAKIAARVMTGRMLSEFNLPDELAGRRFYEPTGEGFEAEIGRRHFLRRSQERRIERALAEAAREPEHRERGFVGHEAKSLLRWRETRPGL